MGLSHHFCRVNVCYPNCHSVQFQIVGGVHLIKDVAAKVKKPTSYATSLMSHLFTNEEMREGCVEPKDGAPLNGKIALDQTKVNLIKSKFVLFT